MNGVTLSTRRLDVAGVVTSTLCAIHCVFLPLVLGSLAGSPDLWIGSEFLEWTFLATSFVVGLCSLLPAYRNQHREPLCLALFCGGILSIFIGRFVQQNALPDKPFVAAGAIMIILSHLSNRYFCTACPKCQG